MAVPLTELDRRRIRNMREAGHTISETARTTGFCCATVSKIMPGYTGKVSNVRLRQAFVESGMSASDVAKELGWNSHRARPAPDTSRVRRTLGLLPETSGQGRRSTRKLIDWETGSLIADAIGVAPRAVFDDDQAEAA